MAGQVEPFFIITSGDMIAITTGLCAAASCIVGVILRWSIIRNIKLIDTTIAGLVESNSKITEKQHAMELQSMPKTECSTCRKECQDRMADQYKMLLESNKDQNLKLDNLIMLLMGLRTSSNTSATIPDNTKR